MKGLTSCKKLFSSRVALILVVLLTSYLFFPSKIKAQETQAKPPVPDKTRISFEERLRAYLDEKTQDVVELLLAREMQLLQMVEGVRDEIAFRVDEGQSLDDFGFKAIYGHADSLVDDYSQELNRLLDIYDDISRLQRLAEYGGDIRALEKLGDVQDSVSAALDDRRLYKKGVYTPERVGQMIDEYATELDSLLSIYDQLERLKVRAADRNDTQALADIRQQKSQLLKIMSKWGSLGPLSEEDYLRFKVEMNRVGEVAKKIDDAAKSRSISEGDKLMGIKRSLLDRLDESIVDLLAKPDYSHQPFPTVSEFVEEWKAERLADIEARLTQYEIIRQKLIQTAKPEQRDRMLSHEILNALSNYSSGRYRTAEAQFVAILKSYSPYYGAFIPLRYYLGECKYQRGAYDAAREDYISVIADSTPSIYRVEALVRMMQYEDRLGTSRNFFNYYKQVAASDSVAEPELMSYANYLAANKYFNLSQFGKARTLLKSIPEKSQYYLPAQLLLGIVYTNINDYDNAVPIFQKLTKEKNYPWTSLNTAYIRNTALLRLGMIYYQRGEYARAIDTFDQVSQGFENYDEALIGEAWANLKLGQYDATLERTHNLLRNYLASNFTYEALILSAHCKRLLNQPETALNSYRYVVRASGVMDMKKQFDKERSRALDQANEFERLEKEALEKRQASLYPEINRVRMELNEFLLQVQEKGDTGTQLLHDYYDERTDLVEKLDELDRIIEWANQQGRPDVARRAARQRARLIKIIETFRADKDVTNTAFLVDFPLAAKEASLRYRKENFGTVYRNLDLEKRRLEKDIEALTETKSALDSARSQGVEVSPGKLTLLEDELSSLRDRLSQFKMWLAENKPGEAGSNLKHWSDLAGFGLSDVIYKERKNRLNQIDYYATQIKTINTILNHRRKQIEAELQNFEDQIRALQDRLISRKIKLEQLEKQTYFDNLYFDTHEREEETWEDQLRMYNKQPQK